MADFRLPDSTKRTTIVGRTGSGKSRFGTWLLSLMPIDNTPWVIVDHKREGLFSEIENIQELSLNEIPKTGGLYLLQPDTRYADHDDALDAWLLNVLDTGGIGIYIDEGYSIKQHSRAFRTVLTQGRSKNVPVITLSQRPTQISKFAFTEADYFAFFQLSTLDDIKTCQGFAPKKRLNLDDKLPPFHSYWYDVAADEVFIMKPVPSDEIILTTINKKLQTENKRKVI